MWIGYDPSARRELNGLLFVYTFTSATAFWLIPFLIVFAISAGINRLTSGRPNYWSIYRGCLVAAVLFWLVGSFGLYYANCRETQSVAYCDGRR